MQSGLRAGEVTDLQAFVFQRQGQPWSSMELRRNCKRVLLAGVRYRVPEHRNHPQPRRNQCPLLPTSRHRETLASY